jgi:type VI secretion system secreted protein VgrG
VILPFDVSGAAPGKGSAPLRMMQPYSGPEEGMHFPLRKGTEVLLAFIDGDPDRPVIAGTVPNPETPSVVNKDNRTRSQIVTAGDNRLYFEDEEGKERILMHSPAANSFIRLGTHNDPVPDYVEDQDPSQEGIRISSQGKLDIDSQNASVNISAKDDVNIKSRHAKFNLTSADASATIFGASAKFYGGAKASAMIGETFGFYLGLSQSVYAGSSNSLYLGQKFELSLASRTGFSGYKMEFTGQTTELEAKHNELVGAVQKLSASHSDLAGKHDSLVAQCSELKASANELAAKHNELVGQCTKLKGSTNGIEGTKVDISGSATKLGGNATELKANETKLSSVSNAVSGLTTIV